MGATSPSSLSTAHRSQLSDDSNDSLSIPPRRSSSSSVRRELPPRMEPRLQLTSSPVVSHFVSQRHPPPPPLNLHPLPEQASAVEEVPPPPVPPRMRRESSLLSERSPPCDGSAPPLPPRKQRNISAKQDLSLGIIDPLSHSLPRNVRIPFHHGATMPLPRRNSERDHLGITQPHFVNVNGERVGSVTPELPPRTYNNRHVVHSRQQSS